MGMKIEGELFEAANEGDVEKVRRLVEQEQVDPNIKETKDHYDVPMPRLKERTPLHLAAGSHRLAVVKYLVEKAGVDVHKADRVGRTALHAACHSDSGADGLAVVRFLVEVAGMSVHDKTTSGNTPLHLACCCGCVETIQYLCEHTEADVDVPNKMGKTPLCASFCNPRERTHRINIVKVLLPKVAIVKQNVLQQSWCQCFPWDLKAVLLQKYAVGFYMTKAFKEFPVHTILEHVPLASDKHLQDCIQNYPLETVSRLDNEGRLPIHRALTSRRGQVKSPLVVSTLSKLVEKSALLRDPKTGMFPFEAAALKSTEGDSGWLNTVYLLFRFNPAVLLRTRGLATAAGDMKKPLNNKDILGCLPTAAKKQKTFHQVA